MTPSLDLLGLLRDRDFSTSLTLIRRRRTVGTDGLSRVVEDDPETIAAVVIAARSTTRADAEATRRQGAMTVVTAAPLSAGAPSSASEPERAPDVIVHGGCRYVVAGLSAHAALGIGFCVAETVEDDDD